MGRSDKQVQLATFFDYDSLDQSHRLVIQQHTGEIRKRLRRSAQDVWEIGQRLADVRSRLKYGQFLAWLKAEFGWSQRTAYNFINVYETFGDRFANLAKVDIATSVLYQLAAPSVPEELRNQVLKSASEGERITQKALKSAIKQHTQLPKEQPQEGAPTKPEIITVIPKSSENAQPSIDGKLPSAFEVTPGWYCLESKHRVFCGDTGAENFVKEAPEAKLAIAVTAHDWGHDWLVDQVDKIVILPEDDLTLNILEQLINILSSHGETIIFPWLPLSEMIAVAHRLKRRIYAGDPNPNRCQRAIAASGLTSERISGDFTTTLAG